MMLLFENIKLALTAIKTNKMRAFLTMLGIIIGISSVIAITSIGNSAKGAINKQFDTIGRGYMYLSINWRAVDVMYESDLFYPDDVEAVLERFSDEIGYATLYRYVRTTTKVGRNEANIVLYGVGASYDEYCKEFEMRYGRMINNTDVQRGKNTLVLDIRAAKRLFGTENAVGQKLEVPMPTGQIKEFTVVGIYEEPVSIFTSMSMGEPTYRCYVPQAAAASYADEGAYDLELYAKSDENLSQLGAQIARYVSRIKGFDDDHYACYTAEEQMDEINQILGILSVAIGAIAAISLLVGGIGIMNIMLVSVTERTREIGIRKSLGARTKDILTQFLIEAVILSVIGGLIGMFFGIGIAAVGMLIVGVDLVVSATAVIGAILFSAAVGLFFGIFPARKAARLDPIEALRYE